MFWKIAHYTLILMIELAQVHKKEGVGITALSEKYNIPVSAFEDIIEQLVAAEYITHSNSSILLKVEPDKISMWDIIESIDKAKVSENETVESQMDKTPFRTSTSIMVDKEIEVVLNMIRYRFKRHKLSAWSEKASKMIYI